jgi:alpha-1,2-mannosyltransferase
LNSVSSVPTLSARSIATPRFIITAASIVLGLLLQSGTAWLLKANINAGFSDFRNFYTAGKIVNEGKSDRLYDASLQEQVQKTFVAPSLQHDFNYLPYIHPPFEAIAFGLFARMSYPTAFWAFWVCNLLLTCICLLVLHPHITHLHQAFGLVILAAALFKPLLTSEIQGQDSILMLLLVIGCYLALIRERPLIAGVFVGVACFKPQQALILLLLVMMVSAARVHTFTGFIGACASLVAASVVALGWKVTVGYPHAVKVFTALYDSGNYHPEEMPNVRGLTISMLQGHVSHQVLTAVMGFISAVVFGLTVWILSRRKHAAIQIRFSVLVMCVLLVAYYGYSHDFTPLLLPVLLIWDFLAREGMSSWTRKTVAAGLVVLVCGGFFSMLAPQLLGCVVLLVWALLWVEMYRSGSSPVSEIPAAS